MTDTTPLSHDTTPQQVSWPSVEGFCVFINEGGVHLRADRASTIEPFDLRRLVAQITAAFDAWGEGTTVLPSPPEADDLDRWDREGRAKYEIRRIARAVFELHGVSLEEGPF